MRKTEKSSGTTTTERRLSKLCEKTFLGLWSYANLHTPEGMKGGKGKGRELCDLMAVIDNNVVLFSDKDISFNQDIDVVVAWKRWRRKSILESAAQLYGAEKWLIEHSQEIYLDEKCNEKFPLEIPNQEEIRIHLVAITSNTYLPAGRYFGEASSGTLMLIPNLPNADTEGTPFVVNDINKNKTFVHVFDDVTIEQILGELDTAHDFVKYLSFKEKAVRNNQIAAIPGEEDLVAFYIENGGLILESMLSKVLEPISATHQSFTLAEGYWKDYLSSPFRKAMKEANEVSYYWDSLIENMAAHILSGTVAAAHEESVLSHERAVRYLAGEGRVARQLLSTAFIEKLGSVPLGIRSSRICFSPVNMDRCFVLVVFPRSDGQNNQEYREQRVAAIKAYSLVCKFKYPTARIITVIGTEPIGYGTRSEDIISVEINALTEEELVQAKSIQSECKVLSDMHPEWFSSYEDQLKPYLDTRGSISNRHKVGRNDPCTCGSGKKYEKCCRDAQNG
ncbi:SEC-C metal-binding domain-containing protein [Nitrosomonas sp.]|uniref:SEC-C metal-binding domain-containing protein n=1 Tax=Nitrosomonas sp. TaxID=42353 RepID=UPI00271E1CE9|nr:SEC-C metal-binding domain-containing protein [Nitrosomonas sp.]MDO8893610.1 SEC-C metal-binding domain-containing protein [Nitrosomonas sp.]